MDIVRRAYENEHGVPGPEDPVYQEVERLINERAYDRASWPRGWGPNPTIKKKRRSS
jgi:hypothetical protein